MMDTALQRCKAFGFVLAAAVALALCTLFALGLWEALALVCVAAFIVPYLVLSVRQPEIIIFLSVLVCFTPLERSVSIHFYMVIALALTLFTKRVLDGRRPFTFDPVLLLFCGLAVIMAVTLPRWVSPYRGFRGSLSLFVLPALFYVIFNNGYITPKGCQKFFTVYYPLICTYINGQLLYTVFKGTAITGYSFQEFHAGFDLGWGKSVFVAAVSMFFLVLSWYTRDLWRRNAVLRYLQPANMVINAVVLILIMARAPVVSLSGAIVMFYIFKWTVYKHRITFRFYYLLIAVALSAVIYAFFSQFIAFLVSRFVHMKTDQSFIVRVYMYLDGWNTFVNNMLIGVGPDQHLFKQFHSYKETDPNNILISYAVSFGSIGLAIIIAIFLYPYYKVRQHYRRNPGASERSFGPLLLPLLTLAVINSCLEVIITSFAYGSLFWVLYALFYRFYDHQIVNGEFVGT